MEVMRSLDHHPSFVEQQKNIYKRIEKQGSDVLYAAWLDDSENERFDNNYRKLFIELEESLKESMQVACSKNIDTDKQDTRPSSIQTTGNVAEDH